MDNAHDEILNENTIRQSKFPENTPGERRNGWERKRKRERGSGGRDWKGF